MNPNPYYYGLVKQIGPWKTTAADMMRGQKEYQYTPNNQAEVPYDVKAGNGMLYETYASQGLIYDASTSPIITIRGKTRRGKITKAKKVQIIDPDGKIVAPTDNYFMNRYMGEMRQEVGRDIIESELGGGLNDMATMSGRPSTASMQSASTSAISVDPSVNAMDQGEADGPMFENLNLGVEQEEMVDRGAQNGEQILNDQIGYVQALEQERILNAAEKRKNFAEVFLGERLYNTLQKGNNLEDDTELIDNAGISELGRLIGVNGIPAEIAKRKSKPMPHISKHSKNN